MIKKYWVGILAIILAAITMYFVFFSPKSIDHVDNYWGPLSVGLGWVLFITQFFYSKSEKIYLLVNNIRLFITNESTKWNFTVSYGYSSSSMNFEQIWEKTRRISPLAKKWHKDDRSVIINMPGYTIRAFSAETPTYENADFLTTSKSLSIQFSDLELPFRTFKPKLEREIIPLIDDIVKEINPEVQKYVAKISFSESNPYFGLFVRKFDLPKVISFNCSLLETNVGNHEQHIRVQKDHIEIITDNLLALQILSEKYVALSWSDDYAS